MSITDFSELLVDTTEVDRLNSIIYELIYHTPREGDLQRPLANFPVAYPSTLSRRDLALLRKKTYWVAEKSDGERFLLLSLASGTYFLDSKHQYYKVERNRFYLPRREDKAVSQDKTLLDCMLVWNHMYQKLSCMVIDVYTVEGEDYGSRFFRSRVEAIREQVVVPSRDRYPSEDLGKAHIPFILQGKEYWNLDFLPTLFDRITHHYDQEEGTHRFIYRYGSRYNENDGIIFVPDERPLAFGIRDDVKKWKWPEFTFVAFSFDIDVETRDDGRPPRTTFMASLGGANGELMPYREIPFRKMDSDRFLKALRDLNALPTAPGEQPSDPPPLNFPLTSLAECYYDPKAGEWCFYRLRDYTRSATPFPQALMQLEATSERLGQPELVAGLNLSSKNSRPRPSSNPATPLTPSTPAVMEKYPSGGAYASEETGESPSPTLNAQTSGVSMKRTVDEVYSGSSKVPANDSKRARTEPSSHR